jgi:DNA-binding ferritin-like protein
MDYTAAAEIGCAGFAAVSGLLGWLWQRSEALRDRAIEDQGKTIREQADAIKEIGRALDAHKLYVAEHYVTQTELTKAVGSLERSIERLIEAVNQNSKETREGFAEIHRRIDTKADK